MTDPAVRQAISDLAFLLAGRVGDNHDRLTTAGWLMGFVIVAVWGVVSLGMWLREGPG